MAHAQSVQNQFAQILGVGGGSLIPILGDSPNHVMFISLGEPLSKRLKFLILKSGPYWVNEDIPLGLFLTSLALTQRLISN